MSYINYIDVSIEEITEIAVNIDETTGFAVDIDVTQNATLKEQEKSITPTREEQTVLPDAGHCLSKVTVAAIPENYGLITYNGYSITVS